MSITWNKQRALLVGLLLCALILSTPQQAAAETLRPDIEIGTRVFASYYYDFSWYDSDKDSRSETNGFNEFELDRAELYLIGWSSRLLSGEIRTEARRVRSYLVELEDETQRVYPDNWGEFQVLMKHAFVHAHIIQPFNVKAGLIDQPLIGQEERAWAYRFVEETLEIRSGTAWHEADIGIELLGAFPGGYGGYNLGVVNGEGYRRPEQNNAKAGYFALRLAPFAARPKGQRLTLSACSRFEWESDPPGDEIDATYSQSGILSYRDRERMTLGIEALHEMHFLNADGTFARSVFASLFGSVRMVDRFWAIYRLDLSDWNTANASGKNSRRFSQTVNEQLDSDEDAELMALGGFAYDLASTFRVALTYRITAWEQTYSEGPGKGDTIQPEHIVKASLEFGF